MDHDLRREKLEELVESVAEGMRLNQLERPGEAKELLRECWNSARRWDCSSAFIAWQLAISYDMLGDANFALKFIELALRLDPFPAPFRNSRDIIVANARRKLSALKITNSGIRGIVHGLAKVGAATPDDHLLLARHCYAHKLVEEALTETDLALKLDPEYSPAQMAKAVVMSGLRWHVEDTKEEAALTFAQVLGAGLPKAEA